MSGRFSSSSFDPPVRGIASLLAVGALAWSAGPAAAARTPAGTTIPNTARATFDGEGGVVSNTAAIAVAELLDVSISADQRTIEIANDTGQVPVAFRVTNEGNGRETFTLAATGGAIVAIAADDDGDGLYDAARDRTLANPALDLQPGASRRFFVLVRDLPASGGRTTITATATAVTGSGAAGTTFAGAGPNGVDAVVGRTTASASASTIIVGGVGAPRLEKSSSVRASDGSARIMPGAVVTWQLAAMFPRVAGNAVVADPIPAGTRFVPGSLSLDGQPLTDAADNDGGRFDGAEIRVSLGTIAAGTRTIRFQTIIQ